MNEIILLDTPPSTTATDLLPTAVPTQTFTSQVYFQKVFAPLSGSQDLCQRVPWRTEGLLNIAKFLSRDDWINSANLVAHLQKYRDSFMATHPDGKAGLTQGGGSLINGPAGFDIVARTDLSKQTDFFQDRGFFVSMKSEMKSTWYFKYQSDILDQSRGVSHGLWNGVYDGVHLSYNFRLNAAQAYPLTNAMRLYGYGVGYIYRRPKDESEYHGRYKLGLNRKRRIHQKSSRLASEAKPRADLPEIPVGKEPGQAKWYQRLLSAKQGVKLPDQPYKRADDGGKGITIFVMDTGFTLTPAVVSIPSSIQRKLSLTQYIGPGVAFGPSTPKRILVYFTRNHRSGGTSSRGLETRHFR